MLFTSWVFLLAYLPVALVGFALLGNFSHKSGVCWLILMSLAFYGFWHPSLIVLISISILFNYTIASLIRHFDERDDIQNATLFFGIALDLTALVYFKYVFWAVSVLSDYHIFGIHPIEPIELPLGISFFTFTQIGYLIDCRQKVTKENSFLSYALFVSFFPHLIAGPILHNGEIMPQFADKSRFRISSENISAGVTIFVIGLLKKALIADTLAPLNNAGFGDADHLQLLSAWGAVLGYSLQLYFDFSGYSDMAIGLALMFNIKFPVNFNSPYKARSIIEFWQRWHMSLTRYITLYVYSPMAMSLSRRRAAKGLPMGRKALSKPWPFISLVATPTLITMALAGIWHGAGLQFLIFGLLHGANLTVNHAWNTFGPKKDPKLSNGSARSVTNIGALLLTYNAVLIGQVFFRAASASDGVKILLAMLGFNGVESPIPLPGFIPRTFTGFASRALENGWADFTMSQDVLTQLIVLSIGALIVWFFPNCQQVMATQILCWERSKSAVTATLPGNRHSLGR
jgi:D-alanyl-lipoteichoic acid acyltransferase DltB (MBOAT superfamily)